MTQQATSRLITVVLGIAILVALIHFWHAAARLRHRNELLVNANEVYQEAAKRRGLER